MPPPELAAHAPRLDVAHPLVIRLVPVARHEARLAALDSFHRRFRQRLRVDIPLVGQVRLDDDLAAIAERLHDRLVFDLQQEAFSLQIGHHHLARRKTLKSAILLRHVIVEVRRVGQDVDRLQPVALADLIVVEIVRRRDLHRARTLCRIGVFVRNDGDQAIDQRQLHQPSDNRLVALVIRMHGNAGIAQHCLGPRGGHDDIVALFFQRDVPVRVLLDIGVGRPVCERIFEVPEMTLHFPVLDFEIRDSGLEMRVPVHEALVAIDQSLAEQLDEHFRHCLVETIVESKALAAPVTAGAEALQLVGDRPAGFLFPLPDALDELVASEIATPDIAFLRQLALDDHLRRDAGMVRARLPQGLEPAHPVIADQHVLQRVVERMPHVQHARDVRRRDHDGVGLALARRLERARAFPGLVEAGFCGFVVETIVNHGMRITRGGWVVIRLPPARPGCGRGRGRNAKGAPVKVRPVA